MERFKELRLVALILLIMAALLAAGCGGGLAQRSTRLLAVDYHSMNNKELQQYYRELSDQLAREVRAARAAKGEGFDVNQVAMGAGDHSTPALRKRWNAVRAELARRKMLY